MQSSIHRRRFLKYCLGSGFGCAVTSRWSNLASAIEPLNRAGQPRLWLSLAAYSFRDYLQHKDPAKRIDLFRFIDFCADQGCAGTELTSYYFAPNFTAEYLIKLRRHAFLRGVAISGTAVGNNFALPKGDKRDAEIASVKKWVDHAAVMGAPHIRIFAGAPQGIPKEEAKKMCIGAIEECCDYAGTKGIFLGLENHGGIVAEAQDMLDIIRAVKSPWFGVNLDTGNFNTDDPYHDLALIAPYAVNVQFKVEMRARGKKTKRADVARVFKILRDANYQGYVALEYEAAEDPWKAVPEHLKRVKEFCSA